MVIIYVRILDRRSENEIPDLILKTLTVAREEGDGDRGEGRGHSLISEYLPYFFVI